MREAFCCTENIATVTDSDAPCVSPSILTPAVSPNSITASVVPQTIQINAVPVSTGFTSVVVTGPVGVIPAIDLEVEFPDKIFFTGVFTVPGDYAVLVSNGAGCTDTELMAFTVDPP